ncbi:hypothetical protein BT67DRAFT_372209 [Trichocladium antarcticum]|uniref:RING-type E3 ubiquitin transferase n=1 Tax=Trichocladium antarcticum TaxID=1450529 RepID=A0AAN6URI1_9PEZI|nr:hypothetical protein BT67DRAFT_372209 [Trichocladium antarcticum]
MPSLSRENARIWLLLVVFFMTLLSRSDGPALISAPLAGGARPGLLREAYSILNSTKWTDFSPHEAKDGAPPWSSPRYLNLTGFREQSGYAWNDLAHFKDRCRQWSDHVYPRKEPWADEWDHGPVKRTWQNATGTVHGKWVRREGSMVKTSAGYNLSAVAPGVGWLEDHMEWGWNVTGSHGTILLRLQEDAADAAYDEETEKGKEPRSAGMAREISAVANIQDEADSASSFAMRLHGVHWPRQGSILLTTTSEKFAGIFGLPHFALGPVFYETSQKLLNRTLDKVLRKKERNRFAEPSNPWTPVVEDEVSIPLPRCEYIMYLQLHPLDRTYIGDGAVRDRQVLLVDKMENELRFPTGAPSRGVPDLQMSLVAWSPDCSYYLESKGPPLFPSTEGEHLVGVKSEVLLSRTKNWMFAFAAVLMGQLWLLKAQMKESNTPSTLGRISFQTAAMMLLADGMVFACSSAWSLSATNTFLPSLMLTFAAFMSMAIGAGFLAEIYKNHEPERRIREREREQTRAAEAAAAAAAAAAAPGPPTQPAPGTLPATATPPIIIPSDQDIDAEIAENTAAGAAAISLLPTTQNPARGPQRPSSSPTSSFASITGTFIFLGIALLILTAMSLSWPPRARALYFNALAFTYLSLWLPQIRRNVWRNSRRAFAWRFMLGQSVLRLAPFAYFYLRRDNILFVETDAAVFGWLVGWVWAQLVVLAVQDVLGPRAGVPAGWVPEVWEYHPVLREADVEKGGMPIGLVSSATASAVGGVAGAAAEGEGDGEGEGLLARAREKEMWRSGMALRSIDCAICTEVLEVPVVRAGAKDPSAAGGLVGVFARRAYMVTPCRHIFHTKCLEGWFRYKLQCPICREELPSL